MSDICKTLMLLRCAISHFTKASMVFCFRKTHYDADIFSITHYSHYYLSLSTIIFHLPDEAVIVAVCTFLVLDYSHVCIQWSNTPLFWMH